MKLITLKYEGKFQSTLELDENVLFCCWFYQGKYEERFIIWGDREINVDIIYKLNSLIDINISK